MKSHLLSCSIVIIFSLFAISKSVSANPLFGSWVGHYYCSQGITSFRLTTSDEFTRQNKLLALFEFFPHPSNPTNFKGSFEVALDMTSDSTFSATPFQWINRPGQAQMIGFSGEIENRSTISGNINLSTCQSFSAELHQYPNAETVDEKWRPYYRDRKKRDRIAAKTAEIEREFDVRREEILLAADALIQNGSGGIEALAAAMETNRIQMLARLEEGVQLIIPPSQNFEIIETYGETRYSVSLTMKFPLSQLDYRKRQELLDLDFSWGRFQQQTNTASISQPFRVQCFYNSISEIPQTRKVVAATLKSFSASRNTVDLRLNCS